MWFGLSEAVFSSSKEGALGHGLDSVSLHYDFCPRVFRCTAGAAWAGMMVGRTRCVGMGEWGLLTAGPPGAGLLVPHLAWDESLSNSNSRRNRHSLVEQKGPRHMYFAEVQPPPDQPHPLPLVASLPFPLSNELLGGSGHCWGGRSLFLLSWLAEAPTALSIQEQQLCILLSINSVGSWEVTSGLRVKQQHGINLKTTAFIFSSVLEKPVWLMLVMTQQNLS